MCEIATPDSWKTVPMPESVAVLDYTAEFTAEEFGRISRGLVPECMEDKWFVYLKDNTLHLHRSWTGHCIYQVEFGCDGDKCSVERVTVNRDPSQYNERDDLYDARLLDFLIRNLLLGQNLPFPMPPLALPPDAPKGLHQHHVSGTGYPEKPFEE